MSQQQPPRDPFVRNLIVGCALGLLLLGVSVLAGWLIGLPVLVTWGGNRAPVPANGAMGLLLFGLGLLASARWGRRWLAVGLLPAAAGLWSLLEAWAGVPVGFDQWMLRHSLDLSATPGRLVPAVAGCFLLAGTAVALLALVRTGRVRLLVLAGLGSLVGAAGLAALLGHATGLAPAMTLGLAAPVALPMAVGLLVLGCAVVALAVSARAPDSGPARWLPVPLMLGCAAATFIVWVALGQRDAAQRKVALELHAASVPSALTAELEGPFKALRRIADREVTGDTTDRLRQADALGLMRDYPSVEQVVWLDNAFRPLRSLPAESGAKPPVVDQGTNTPRRLALMRARDQRQGTVAAPVTGADGRPALMLGVPIYRGEKFMGAVAAEVRAADWVAAGLGRLSPAPSCTVALGLGTVALCGELPPADKPASAGAVDRIFNVLGQPVRLVVSPGAAAAQPAPPLTDVVLCSGLVFALLLGLVVDLAQKARYRQLLAEDSADRLIAEDKERLEVEARLKVSEERLSLALEAGQVGIFDWDPIAGQVHYSPGVWRMLGYDPAQMAPRPAQWDGLIHPEDTAAVRRNFSRSSRPGFLESEYRVRNASGEWRWMLERAKCVAFAADGAPRRIVGTVQDISPRKQAEEALRLSQAEARKLAIVASITDNLVVITDGAGHIEWANDSFARLLGCPLAEVAGRPIAEVLLPPPGEPTGAGEVRQAYARRMPTSTEISVVVRSGKEFHLNLELQPVLGERGEIEKFIAVLHDITARTETERTLRLAKAQAEAATRAKSDFLASMSHEIRTPMNGVIGLARLLLDTPLNAEQEDCVRTIQSSGDALVTIVNEILDFSKIEAGRMELERYSFQPADCVEEVMDLFSLMAGEKGVELSYWIGPGVPEVVEGDVARLRQVLVNLVGNAVKFTAAGRVAVELRPGGAPGLLAFTVTDTGAGIALDRLDQLFQPFSQGDASITRRYGGTGLGLAISKRLVELMGGSIGLVSKVGEGTEFHFTVQMPASPEPSAPADHPTGIGRRAVVVEDDPVAQRFIVQVLERDGYLTLCYSSCAAMKAGLAGVAAPDLVLVDHSLPDGNGLDAAAAVRAAYPGVQVPVVLASLAGKGPAREELSAAAVRGYVAKPLRRQLLRERILSALAPASGPAALDGTAVKAGLVTLARRLPLKVLLVEDNPVNKKVALRLLGRLGYKPDSVPNGAEAVRAVAEGAYQLVFMDVQMPEMDGLNATRRIRDSLPKERQPVIVALTANAITGDAERCRAAGMDDYVAKPVTPEDIYNAIVRQFGRVLGLEEIRRSL